MTEVLRISESPPEGNFGASATPIKRNTSRTSLLLGGTTSNINGGQQTATTTRTSVPSSYARSRASNALPQHQFQHNHHHPRADFDARASLSFASSASTSPRLLQSDLSSQSSYASSPASSLSLNDGFCREDEPSDFQFPSYEDEEENADDESDDGDEDEYDNGRSNTAKDDPDATPPATSPDLSPSKSSPSRPSANAQQSGKPNPLNPQSVGDDTAIQVQPSRHVDYLSHNWKEEDIWSSWRHIVGKRKELENWERLENASWRTWAKSKNRLATVSPEALNWMKDHDVTWLYGPLQTGGTYRVNGSSPIMRSRLPRNDSFPCKKSILKKRSLSEAMLQRSLSNSTLVRQAVDSLVSQVPTSSSKWGGPSKSRINTRSKSDFLHSRPRPVPSCIPADTPQSLHSANASTSSSSTSESETPCERLPCARRHIHFSEKVEQCIAINKDGDEHDEDDDDDDDDDDDEDGEDIFLGNLRGRSGSIALLDEDNDEYGDLDDDSSEDDGVIMMRTVSDNQRKLSNRGILTTPRSSFSENNIGASSGSSSTSKLCNGGTSEVGGGGGTISTPISGSGNSKSTIAMLPCTTLKYRGDTPEPPEDTNSGKSHLGLVPDFNINKNKLPTSSPRSSSSSRGILVHSASQETIKPSRPSSNFLLDDEDEDMGWQPSTSPLRSPAPAMSLSSSAAAPKTFPLGGVPVPFYDDDEDDEYNHIIDRGISSSMVSARTATTATHGPASVLDPNHIGSDRSGGGWAGSSSSGGDNYPMGMRRTPSGMFMPYDDEADEDEDDLVATGLFGRVVDTVNTARDIAHVIWNVGWRR